MAGMDPDLALLAVAVLLMRFPPGTAVRWRARRRPASADWSLTITRRRR